MAKFLERIPELEKAFSEIENSETKGQDSILFLKWNYEGLHVRVSIAAEDGMLTPDGQIVTNANELKEAIMHFICGDEGGIDIGGFQDTILFVPGYRKDKVMNDLILKKQYLRRHGGTRAHIENSGSTSWPDLVDYIHAFTVISEDSAIGPVDVKYYFNC
eukprot:CAMPEP_0170078986 /NCGR_PEP_ID=MMETSP0019_2-20121128/15482_1 /TAXON_ID=98059 /ORGANISM="Dinobryon sp., Strain UTEXLB2267" /LENGTH=159 /DNA_ID=CAMNT_0010292221 /DNA_START=62 /DNA_END=541 /DNA_ORIENTATION=+